MTMNALPPVPAGGTSISSAQLALLKAPGSTAGIVGFVLSFFPLLNFAGLIVSIVALVRSRKAGHQNGFALAGIIIGGVGVAVTVLIVAVVVPTLLDAALTCARLGAGVHVLGNATYTCTPSSFYVRYGF